MELEALPQAGPRPGAERVFQCFFARFGPQACLALSSYSKKQVNKAVFSPNFTEYLKEKIKKYVSVSTETSF